MQERIQSPSGSQSDSAAQKGCRIYEDDERRGRSIPCNCEKEKADYDTRECGCTQHQKEDNDRGERHFVNFIPTV